ncbi:MAG: DUF4032 domain-containing protein [Acidimicrobiia bacterium]|nr:DUF4032 domain-containing protein [Acidimicrobiia bacterium]
MSIPTVSTRPGHPDFLDLPWDISVADWSGGRVVELPTGVHRHPIAFVSYDEGLYAIKELPRHLAHHEYESLRILRDRVRPVAPPVGVVERGWVSADEEWSSAIITEYVPFTFTYRELIRGGGFGDRRDQMLDAFAGLLVELHLAGGFWGDCSLSNVLYRYDAGAVEAIMIDAETVEIRDDLSEGQRRHDLEIMEVNVAGGMADIALSQGSNLDDADLDLGTDIIARYNALWKELTVDPVIGPEERYLIRARINRLNDLGFEVGDVTLLPDESGGNRVRMSVKVGGRNFHSARLYRLARIEAAEHQARQILSDLHYHSAREPFSSAESRDLMAMMWRVQIFEPLLHRIRTDTPDREPVQGYADFLHHRFLLSSAQGRDVGSAEAYVDWIQEGFPGYDPAQMNGEH